MGITYPLTLPAAPGFRNVEWHGVAAVAGFTSPFTLDEQVQVHQGQKLAAKVTLPPMNEVAAGAWIATQLKLNGKQGTFLFGDSIRTVPYGLGTGSPVIDGGGQTGQSILTRGWPVSTNGLLVAGVDWVQIGTSVGSVLSGIFSAVPNWGTDIFIVDRTSTQVTIMFTIACPLTGGTLDWDVESARGIKNINPGASQVSVTAGTGIPRLHKMLNNVDSDSSGEAIIDIWPRLRESPEDGAVIFLNSCKGLFRLKENYMTWNIDYAKMYGLEFDVVEAT